MEVWRHGSDHNQTTWSMQKEMFKQLFHQNSPISSPAAAVLLETALSKLIRVIGMAHCCLLSCCCCCIGQLLLSGTKMSGGLPASTERCRSLKPTYFSVGYAWFTDSYILCHSFWILFLVTINCFSGNHQRFDIMLYGKLRFVIILIGTDSACPPLYYCGIVTENIFPGKINLQLMYWRKQLHSGWKRKYFPREKCFCSWWAAMLNLCLQIPLVWSQNALSIQSRSLKSIKITY